ncbi:MAG: imidazolonepropionase [Planctomycetota bacterium]
MVDLLIHNASQILTCAGTEPKSGHDAGEIGLVEGPENGAVAIDAGKIVAVGPEAAKESADEEIDAHGGVVLPGFVDCHTHAVWIGSRAHEFEERGRGVNYEMIAKRGGGIRASMRMLREASDEELNLAVLRHLDTFLELGTTTIEAKSGYGLSLDAELRSLRALKQDHTVEVVRTCLAAHSIPPEFDDNRDGYLDLVCDEIYPAVVEEQLADYCDVFCEVGVFTFQEAERVLLRGKELGLRPRVHAEQLSHAGGGRLAARVGAITADHLEFATKVDATAMRDAGVIAVLLPAANYILDQAERPSARSMINLGLPIALGTDFNPGSAPTQSTPLNINIAVTRFGMSIAEAIVSSTINAAHAAGVGDRVGSLQPGYQADVIICDTPDYRDIAYRFGVNPVRTVIKHGKVVCDRAAQSR